MTEENIIKINGGAYGDVKKALRAWVEIYNDQLAPGVKFELYRNGNDSQVIKVKGVIDNELFNYLVNYLRYPEGVVYNVDVEGYTTATDPNLFPVAVLRKRVLVYVSPRDNEHDNVSITTADHDSFKISFDGSIKKETATKTYNPPPNLERLYNPETIKPVIKTKTEEQKSIEVVHRRFKLLAGVTVALLIADLLVLFFDRELFIQTTLGLGVCIAVWFLSDYKMLQSDKYYLYSVALAILFIGYCAFAQQMFLSGNINLSSLGALHPLTLLIVQRPVRYLFKKALRREPVVDKPPPSFWDFVYSVILFISMSFLPFLING